VRYSEAQRTIHLVGALGKNIDCRYLWLQACRNTTPVLREENLHRKLPPLLNILFTFSRVVTTASCDLTTTC
jgi:hypothetical protein